MGSSLEYSDTPKDEYTHIFKSYIMRSLRDVVHSFFSADDLLVVFLLPKSPLLIGLDLLQVGHGRGIHGESVLKQCTV